VSRTIREIESKLRNHHQLGWETLGKVLNENIGGFSEQNFLAHAGLEYNVTEICKSGDGEIMLRYREDRRQCIERASINGLFND